MVRTVLMRRREEKFTAIGEYFSCFLLKVLLNHHFRNLQPVARLVVNGPLVTILCQSVFNLS